MKKPRTCSIAVLACAFILLHVGCRTLSTVASPPQYGSVDGMLYYLPIGKITIKGEFAPIGPQPSPSSESANRSADQAIASSSPAGGAGEKPSTDKPTTEKPGAGGSIIISAGGLTVTLTPELEADISAGELYANPRANYLYDDELRLTVNSKGLLSTGKVTTEDKTADIAGALASIAAQVSHAPFLKSTETASNNKGCRLPFHFTFHPSDHTEVAFVQSELVARGIDFTVTPKAQETGKQVSPRVARPQQFGDNGLIFRPTACYHITLGFRGSDPNDSTHKELTVIKTDHQFVMPDPNRLYEIDYPRMAFVKKVKEIGFSDGMLTDYHQKVPSPILGFIGIPKAILQALVPVPGTAPAASSAATSGTTSSPVAPAPSGNGG